MTNLDRVKPMTADAFGDWAEDRTEKILTKAGWQVTRKKGSFGASDMTATKGSKKWYIQVKATRNNSQPPVGKEDRTRVINSASSNGAIPVIAMLWFDTDNGTYRLEDARTEAVLHASA